MPHGRGLHGAHESGEVDIGFPVPTFLVFIGYSIILLIDKVAFGNNQFHNHGN